MKTKPHLIELKKARKNMHSTRVYRRCKKTGKRVEYGFKVIMTTTTLDIERFLNE